MSCTGDAVVYMQAGRKGNGPSIHSNMLVAGRVVRELRGAATCSSHVPFVRTIPVGVASCVYLSRAFYFWANEE